jgi:hypothetical protein
MLLMTVAMGLLLQNPQHPETKNWVESGHDAARPGTYTISGPPELSREEAWVAAQRNAFEDHANRVREVADVQAAAISSKWLPEFVRERVVTEWARKRLARAEPKILDREFIVRDHGFGLSYQAVLLLDGVNQKTLRKRSGLADLLADEEQRFVVKFGGMLGLWGLLALVMTWIDRLTRGYMTKRLYAIGALLALIGPACLVLL